MNENLRVITAQMSSFLTAPTRNLDVLKITAGTEPIDPINLNALVLRSVKEIKPRTVCYSVLQETGLILALVLGYNKYLLLTRRQRLRRETTLKNQRLL